MIKICLDDIFFCIRRFVCISDTHGLTGNLQLPAGDVLIHAGDFSNTGTLPDCINFREFLDSQIDFRHKVVIAGNHDLTFDVLSYPETWKRFRHPVKYDVEACRAQVIEAPNVTYLEDSSTTIEGIKIYGSPWQPEFCDWAFNLPRGKPCRDVRP